MPGGLAARVAGWRRRYGAWPAVPTPAATPATPPFPQTPLDLRVEIFVDGSWIDITPSVYGGGRAEITVARGRPNEASRVERSRAALQVNNRGGQFSPRNPVSWLYGKIGRNTPLRIAIGADVRFHGEVSEWPGRWDVSGQDVSIPIEASGVLRRLGQGASPLKSTLYRGYTSLASPPKAYWPCEDGGDATGLASGLGGPPMTVKGTPTLASNTDFKSSEALPVLSSSEWTGTVPGYSGSGSVQVWTLVSVPSGGATAGQGIFSLYMTGTVRRWTLIYGTGGTLELRGYDADDAQVETSGVIGFNLNGNPQRLSTRLSTNGADLDWELLGQLLNGSIGGLGGTFTSQTLGRATRVVVNPGGGLGDVAFGHVSIHDEVRSPSDLVSEFLAYTGERAGRRVKRLCAEEGISFRAAGNLGATTPMGPQLPKTLLDLLQEAADADQGILYEPRDVFGLAYRTRESLYRQPAALALDYSAKHLSGIEPTDDDQAVRNDITVQREGGSSARAVQASGPLSVQPPPGGVGRYDEQVTLSLAGDGLLADAAGWRLHLGTVDEARYPVLRIDLARQPFAADPVLAAAVQGLDLGDRLTIDHPPPFMPPDQISQLAQGMAETMGNFTHRIDINCAPASPWDQPAVYDDGVSRYAGDGSSLAVGIDAAAVSVLVATPSGPVWSHADGDFDIRIGGEVMTCTAIIGATSPQTFTVARSRNGVVKAHLSGEEVALDHPRVYVP